MEIIITMRAEREKSQRKSDALQIQISQTCQKSVPKFYFFLAITFVTCTSTS